MFNPEIIHFLQGFDHPIIFGFMWLMSMTGLSPIILCFALGIAFGLDLKRGLVIINMVAWTAFFAFLLKNQINFSTPETIEGHGFPSTRMAILTSFWLSFLLLFKRSWVRVLSVLMISFGSIACMYMGYAFLGDVLGGISLGLVMTAAHLFIINKSRYFKLQAHDNLSLSYFWLPWLAMPFAAYITYWQLASVLGLNMAVIFIVQRRNFPVYHLITWKRIAATLVVICSFLAAYFINAWIQISFSSVVDFLIITVLNFLVVLTALSLSRRLFLIKYRLAF